MKKPIDKFGKLTKEEQEEKLKSLRDLEVSKEEERAMIFGALRTILPPILIFFAVVYLLIRFIF